MLWKRKKNIEAMAQIVGAVVVGITRELAICPKLGTTTHRWIHCLLLFRLPLFPTFLWKCFGNFMKKSTSFHTLVVSCSFVCLSFTLFFGNIFRNIMKKKVKIKVGHNNTSLDPLSLALSSASLSHFSLEMF